MDEDAAHDLYLQFKSVDASARQKQVTLSARFRSDQLEYWRDQVGQGYEPKVADAQGSS